MRGHLERQPNPVFQRFAGAPCTAKPQSARQIDQEVPKTPIFVLFLLSHHPQHALSGCSARES
jgi:hypothetical protein